ncbi:MAG: hypothetical protein K0V04_14070 [Deltaproteobacteria bacterium]|nr:hypothetical protein [Deltaproteobacteria bacterium]
MAETPLLQRVGMRYMARRDKDLGASPQQVDSHRLDEAEQRALLRIQWGLVGKSALLGALSGLVCALAELWADANLAPAPDAGWRGALGYWAFLGSIIGVASIVEVLLLYVESLRAVQAIARTTGTRLFVSAGETEPASPMSAALVRAALELPNPPPEGYAIDPLREVSRWRALAVGLLYKAKIGLTSFLLKLIIRRALGRAALRMWLVFVGVPVTAFWNGLVAYIVIREARLRAIGPSAARRFCDLLDYDEGEARTARTALIWRAVAATVVRTHELHPNVEAFMAALREDIGAPPTEKLDDTALFLEQLAAAPVQDQRQALRALAVAAVLDGKTSGDERKLVRQVADVTGLAMPPRALARLRRRFVGGKVLDATLLEALAP